MKIKHFVITRFLCDPNLGYGEKIFDNDIIYQSINYVKNYFLQSLNNQSNKNFEIVFLINDNHDLNSNIKLLKELNTKIKLNIVKKSELNSFLKENSIGFDYLITTRMDYDDLIFNNAVNEIQLLVTEHNNENIILYGYDTGYVLYLNDNKIYLHDVSYSNSGYFSVFESLAINLKTYNKMINIYDLGNHTKIKNTDKLENPYIINAPKERNYVWVRHPNTGSEFHGIEKDRRINEVIVNDFKQKFGIEL